MKMAGGRLFPVTIREISLEDEDEWTRLGRKAYTDKPEFQEGHVLWPEIHHILDKDQSLYLLAEYEEKAVGRLALQSTPSSSIILDLCVIPSHRHKGIGKKLLDTAISKAKDWGKENVHVMGDVDEEDTVPVAFFHSCGFAQRDGYSVFIDLQKPYPASILKNEDVLRKEGFVLRRLQATDRDIALAARLQKKYFPGFPGYVSVKEVIQHIVKKNFIILAMEKNGQPAGFVIGAAHCTTRNYRHVIKEKEGLLTSIAVCEDFRRKGIASALVLGLMRAVKEKEDEMLLYGGCGMGTPSMRLAQKCGGEKLRKHYSFDLKL
jgi:N-acetylglutamate synthase-like GNAT family acetyltransferase